MNAPNDDEAARELEPRKEQPSTQLARAEFAARWRERLCDPRFARDEPAVQAVIDAAWDGYDAYRKNPLREKAGPEFADPEALLPVEWLATRRALQQAQARHDEPSAATRVLVISGSMRSSQTCPGETPKSYRMAKWAEASLSARAETEVDFLDLSLLTAEYGRVIHPCKACASTAMPLCHWPCSCYPNFAMGQVNDWMAELYPRFVAAHAILIVTPVNWYQAPAGLKAMMDRLVCADGGNPDPTTTGGKDPKKAKRLELAGWSYPRHLRGRTFGVIVHGDTAGSETLRRIMTDWANDMQLLPVEGAALDRMVGYFEPYATSHAALDRDEALRQEIDNVASALHRRTLEVRARKATRADDGLDDPRPK
jgi:multimeric flavodoxin WrbA